MTKINTQPQKHKTREQRFYEKIEKTGNCWLWNSAIGSRGYGIFWHSPQKKSIFAHRFSYEIHKGKIDENMVVMHSCDNPASGFGIKTRFHHS